MNCDYVVEGLIACYCDGLVSWVVRGIQTLQGRLCSTSVCSGSRCSCI